MFRRCHLATLLTVVITACTLGSNAHADWLPAFPELLLPSKGLDKKTTRQLDRGIAAVRNSRWQDAYTSLQPLLEAKAAACAERTPLWQ